MCLRRGGGGSWQRGRGGESKLGLLLSLLPWVRPPLPWLLSLPLLVDEVSFRGGGGVIFFLSAGFAGATGAGVGGLGGGIGLGGGGGLGLGGLGGGGGMGLGGLGGGGGMGLGGLGGGGGLGTLGGGGLGAGTLGQPNKGLSIGMCM